jgi:hypothetical protein
MHYGKQNAEPNEAGGFALLGRKNDGFLEVLAYDAEEGKVLCLFETQELAGAFSRTSPEVRGQGWRVHVVTMEKLPDLVEDFDYVTITPPPRINSKKELISAPGFARSLRRRSSADAN